MSLWVWLNFTLMCLQFLRGLIFYTVLKHGREITKGLVTPTLKSGQRSAVEAGNPGNRKEVDELGMEASDHPYGEEVECLMDPEVPPVTTTCYP